MTDHFHSPSTHVGDLCLVLHAHLPFVRHPEDEDFLEEDWLYEAMCDTYLPLLDVFERLHTDGIIFRLTMSISPTLAEMLSDPLLQSRFEKRLVQLCELAEKEVHRTSKKPYKAFHESAQMYLHSFQRSLHLYREEYDRNLLNGFRRMQEAGHLEIITCGATHGFLPLMAKPNSMRAQILTAQVNYEKHFGKRPRGIWLPECGYDPKLDDLLDDAGFDYFFLDTHGLLHSSPEPKYGVYAPVLTPTMVAAFARDVDTSRQVWSREIGYPGDFEYREFYRDIGYDAFYDYIRPYLHRDGVRRNIGIKHHRITGIGIDLADKEPYRPQLAKERAALHAKSFLENREKQLREVTDYMDRPPMIVAPFDAELFGHWWYEGPYFLEALFRETEQSNAAILTVTPGDILDRRFPLQMVQPSPSSWGHLGHYDVWLNESNDWIYRHLHECERRMIELAHRYPNANGILQRTLNQAARELLLAQSSDWAFIMTSNTAVSYARRRTREHVHRFLVLYDQISSAEIREDDLAELEWKDHIFAEIDYRVYLNRSFDKKIYTS